MTTQAPTVSYLKLSLVSLVLPLLACGASDKPAADGADQTGTTETSGVETGESDATSGESGDTGTTTETDGSEELCGNGVVDADEVCDDGVNDGAYGGCMSDCQGLAAYCGDGVVDSELETCDEGDTNGTITCNVVCQVPGTVLAQFEEFVPTMDQPAHAYGLRAVLWNGNLTLVAGGWTTSVWRIDPEMEATIDLGITDVHVNDVTGALGLTNGDLVVVGSNPIVLRFNDQLQEVWNSGYLPVDGLLGVAPFPGGFMAGARQVEYSVPKHSSYYALGFIENGTSLWNAVETVDGTSQIYGRDFRGLSDGRGVLLTDGIGGTPEVRIYDSSGTIDGELALQQLVGGYRTLCPGDDRFFLLGFSQALVGFDDELNPTTNTAYTLNSAGQLLEAACAVLPNQAPVVATTILDSGSSIIEIIGFEGVVEAWHTPLQLDYFASAAPALFVDAERSRVWVFQAGESTDAERFHWAAAIAI